MAEATRSSAQIAGKFPSDMSVCFKDLTEDDDEKEWAYCWLKEQPVTPTSSPPFRGYEHFANTCILPSHLDTDRATALLLTYSTFHLSPFFSIFLLSSFVFVPRTISRRSKVNRQRGPLFWKPD